ncbi:hypothetical protein GCM10007978_01670 [Shewanella hanedai]|uniref:Tetratricopeptide repeat protein n=1 Tax=Shewanella hanedai TaxID=25 RepID=A0A553JV03_SHEHA|nr:hypothetical protein [Shewanella hanedai]TRY16279.1 hypothetical protein FN961_01225 [Shewanella hanedai]GGI67674.1 hypothetical protein GCM10007978_01670 [Shewanella hanedai]
MNNELLDLIENIRSLPSEEALSVLENTSVNMEGDPDWLFLIACFQADNNRVSDAKNNFFTLLDQDPDNELARIQLACIHLSLGEFKQILYLLCPYLVWQKNTTCIASLAHALLSFVQNDKDKVEYYLAEAKESGDAPSLQLVIQQLDALLKEGIMNMGNKIVSAEESKNNTTSHLLNNLYSKKY